MGKTIKGDENNNTITGTNSDDKLYGYGGDDYFYPLKGNDFVNGGEGFDTVNYSNSGGSISVNLKTGFVTDSAGSDKLVGVERVTGTGGNDVFVAGKSGEFWFRGEAGNDKLTGGGGFDWADYNNAGKGLVVDLQAGTSSGGGAGNDTLVNIDNIRGSANDDKLYGDNHGNRIRGMAGNDLIDGRGGVDMVDYKDVAGAVNVNLAKGTASGADGNDTLRHLESVRASDFNDVVTGDNAANYLYAGAGNDIISGGGGKDTLGGDVGVDTLTGGAGADTFLFYGGWSGKTASTRDVITDFAVGSDHLDLSGFDADTSKSGMQHFRFQSTEGASFTGVAGQLHYVYKAGTTIVEGDLNGDRKADFQIELDGIKHLTAHDFLL
jgi:Ca2+-binding RTX toxin-like protein